MKVFFFLKNVQNLMQIPKMQQKFQKKFLLFQIIASDLAALNCLHQEENTCDGQSMRQQTVFSLFISIREISSNPTAFTVINNYAKGGVVQISTVLLPFSPYRSLKCPLKCDFLKIYLSTYFEVRNFGHTSAIKLLLFGKRLKFNVDSKNFSKNPENISCF